MLFFELSLVVIFAYFLASLASFLGVVIWRTAREESFISGRSRCESCRHQLSWRDNLPLLSFIFLAGRCRSCQQPIAKRHFISELLAFSSAFVFYGLYLSLPSLQAFPPFSLIIYFLFFFVLTFVVWADLQYLLVPDFLVALLTTFAIVLLFIDGGSWLMPFSAAVFAVIFFLLLYFVAKKLLRQEALGLGDVKLMVPLALILSWPGVLVAIFLAFLSGGFFAMMVLALGRKKIGQALPFAPFLVLGAALSFFYGQALLDWYLKFLF